MADLQQIKKKIDAFPAGVKVFAVAVVVFGILALTGTVWKVLELKAYDFRMRLAVRYGFFTSPPSNKVAVVKIESEEIHRKKPIIFWYPEFGSVLKKLGDYGVRSVGVDFIPIHSLSEKMKESIGSLISPEDAKKYGPFIDQVGDQADQSMLMPLLLVSDRMRVVFARHLDNYPFFYEQIPMMQNVHVSSAVLTADREDEVIRKQRLTLKKGEPTFAATMSRPLTGRPPDREDIYINYTLTKNIPVISFKDLLEDKVDRNLLEGRAVVFGYFVSDDMHQVPMKKKMDGPLIQALIAETLLTGKTWKDMAVPYQMAILFLLSLTGVYVAMHRKPLTSLAGMAALTILYALANIVLFINGTLVVMFPHVGAPLLAFALIYPYRYLSEERVKQKIYKTFSYYVDQQVIDSLIHQDADSLLKGNHRDICILFLDIRNFTKLSETNNADDIIALLNIFFERTTHSIQKYGGMVNKFLGDGLMAFFLAGENTPCDAVAASLEIVEAAKAMNDEPILVERIHDWKFAIGIGIHYGDVIIGNIGSEKKMDFTIMGPSVNMTSRIESLTKEFGKAILVSERVSEMIKDRYVVELAGKKEVKGIAEAINVYTVVAP